MCIPNILLVLLYGVAFLWFLLPRKLHFLTQIVANLYTFVYYCSMNCLYRSQMKRCAKIHCYVFTLFEVSSVICNTVRVMYSGLKAVLSPNNLTITMY
jgi:hypothetical protein